MGRSFDEAASKIAIFNIETRYVATIYMTFYTEKTSRQNNSSGPCPDWKN